MKKYQIITFYFLLSLLLKSNIYGINHIGTVNQLTGDVITKSYINGEINYLQIGDTLPLETFLITKPGSSLTIKTYHHNIIKVKEKTKMTLLYDKDFNAIIARVLSGEVFYETNLNNKPNFYISGKDKETFYTSRSFILKHNKNSYRFIKKDNGKIISLSKTNNQNDNNTQKNKEKDKQASNKDIKDEFAGIFSNDMSTSSVENIFTKTASSTEEKEVKKVDQVIKSHISLKFYSKSTLYFQKPDDQKGDVDDQFLHQDIKLSLTDTHKIDHFSSINYNLVLEASNRKGLYNDFKFPQNMQSSQRDYFYINELYYLHSSDNYDIQIGKKILKLGKGIVYSPTDSITATDVSVPTSPVYLGNYIISFDYYKNDWTYSLIYFPVITPNKSASQNSRFTLLYNDINFNLKQELKGDESIFKRPILLKASGTKFETDWMFTFYNGANPTPAIRNDISLNGNTPTFSLVQEFVPITFVSTGFSTLFKSLELHGEILLQHAKEGRDDSFIAQMLGTRYTMDSWPKIIGIDNIDFILEYGKETLKEAQTKPFYATSSLQTRIYQNSFTGSVIFNFSQRSSINYDFHMDYHNNGSATVLSYNYASINKGQFRIKAEIYEGDSDSIFGIWDKNDNIAFEYTYTF